jgi:2-hydroxy-3-keto-5-methylthiopentenyl-1-phosphate phosphatase
MTVELSRKIVVICDFDGTISRKDVNYSIFRYFGGDRAQAVEDKYWNSEIGLRESLKTQYEIIGIDEKAFEKYVMDNMEMDESFFDFCDFARNSGIEVIIISGGFINYIRMLFNKHGRPMDIQILSNELKLKDGILVPAYGSVPECIKHYGPCGICKLQHILMYKREHKVIYVGDGHTDRCAAESADLVFAKDNLEKFCRENSIKYVHYNSFRDVEEHLRQHLLKQTLF